MEVVIPVESRLYLLIIFNRLKFYCTLQNVGNFCNLTPYRGIVWRDMKFLSLLLSNQTSVISTMCASISLFLIEQLYHFIFCLRYVMLRTEQTVLQSNHIKKLDREKNNTKHNFVNIFRNKQPHKKGDILYSRSIREKDERRKLSACSIIYLYVYEQMNIETSIVTFMQPCVKT